MKKQDDLSVGGSIAVTIVFAAMAIYTYQTDGGSLTWIPAAVAIAGVGMTIAAICPCQLFFVHL